MHDFIVKRVCLSFVLLLPFAFLSGGNRVEAQEKASGLTKPTETKPTSETKSSSALTLSQRIAQSAKDSLGKEMWHGYGLRTGFLGCAAAVSNVLKNAGVNDAHSAGVVVMRGQLMHGAHAYKEFVLKNGSDDYIPDKLILKTSQPGDVLLAFLDAPTKPNTGGNAHCGIMGEGVSVYTNDWNDGKWKHVNIHTMFESYRHIQLLRLLPEPRKKGKS